MTAQTNLLGETPTEATPPPQKESLFGEAEEAKTDSYLVLARKYRPIDFTQLIGQEAMVRTLTNAFESGRVPHAIMLSGMRGVGKTTTARLIARAVNYTNEKGVAQNSTAMKEMTEQCRSILKSRHPDVIEMDAASRTGIDDIREIIDSIAYRPVMARKKIYIIDEVHMLSSAAFNGLLKTLEEPPDHVMFIFATTEIHKVPVTILSRCQRFDLRRLTLEETKGLLASALEKENLTAEEGALLLLARAAEGSARDSLSLLDQAIAFSQSESQESISEGSVTEMLGLAGRAELLGLFDAMMQGDTQKTLVDLQKRFDYGADPLLVLRDCADLTHFLTRRKIAGSTEEDYKMASADRERANEMSKKLSLESLALVWQMLLKGLEETRFAHDPYKSAEMIIIRITHAQNIPSWAELAENLESRAGAKSAAAQSPAAGGQAAAPAPPQKTESPASEVLSHFPGAKVLDKKS